QQFRGRINPEEPKQCGEQKPLRWRERPFATPVKGEHREQGDRQIAENKEGSREARHFQDLETSSVAGQYSQHSHSHTQVAEGGSCSHQQRLDQRSAAEVGEEPKGNSEASLETEPVEQRILVSRPDSPIGQPGAICEKIRGVKFERGNKAKKRGEDEPNRRA